MPATAAVCCTVGAITLLDVRGECEEADVDEVFDGD